MVRTYWRALVDIEPRAPAQWDEVRGGVVWIVGAGSDSSDFKQRASESAELSEFQIMEWLELAILEEGYSCEAFDGDSVAADLEARGGGFFIDEIQWYAAEDDE